VQQAECLWPAKTPTPPFSGSQGSRVQVPPSRLVDRLLRMLICRSGSPRGRGRGCRRTGSSRPGSGKASGWRRRVVVDASRTPNGGLTVAVGRRPRLACRATPEPTAVVRWSILCLPPQRGLFRAGESWPWQGRHQAARAKSTAPLAARQNPVPGCRFPRPAVRRRYRAALIRCRMDSEGATHVQVRVRLQE
jgi:hypothetical protein